MSTAATCNDLEKQEICQTEDEGVVIWSPDIDADRTTVETSDTPKKELEEFLILL
jgi:hypothetical protein